MKLAILFWFHDNPGVCANRLEIIRKYNPDASIYGLYGGEREREEKLRAVLQDDLDDFFKFPGTRTGEWKWWNGDQMITEWYRTRGRALPWDTVVGVHWDMIVVGGIGTLFSGLRKDEILLSGLRPVREIERWWFHVNKQNRLLRAEYHSFLERVRDEHGYDEEPLACQFIVACLPRSFLEPYSKLREPNLGYLEYKIPIYAQIFGTPFCIAHPFQPCWDKPIFSWYPSRRWNRLPPRWAIPARERTLNAFKRVIPRGEISRQLRAPDGARIFHPVYRLIAPGDLR